MKIIEHCETKSSSPNKKSTHNAPVCKKNVLRSRIQLDSSFVSYGVIITKEEILIIFDDGLVKDNST